MRVLISGVDTLVLTYLAAVAPATIERLAAAKEEARQKRELSSTAPTLVMLGGREWLMLPNSAPPYKFLLSRPDEMDVKIAGRTTLAPGTPTVVVELRSELLWRGYDAAAAAAAELAKEALGAPEACLEAVSRLDLCADFQGWEPTGCDDELRRFVRRIRKGVHRHGADESFTGYSLGLGLPFQARLYDKTEEIKGTGKAWFRDLWARKDGYEPEAPVWRLELQARTEALTELGVRVDWLRNVSPRLDEVWRYAFGHPDWRPEVETEASVARRAMLAKERAASRRCEGLIHSDSEVLRGLDLEVRDEQRDQGAWISLREPTAGPRAEWPIDPDWRELQRVVFADAAARRACRLRQREAQIDNLRMQLAGTLASLAALAGARARDGGTKEERNHDALWNAWIEFSRRQLEADRAEARDFAARLDEKGCAREIVHELPERVPLPPAPWIAEPRRFKDHEWSAPAAAHGPHPIDGDHSLLWNRAWMNYRPARLIAGPEQTLMHGLDPVLDSHERARNTADELALTKQQRDEGRRLGRFVRTAKWGDNA